MNYLDQIFEGLSISALIIIHICCIMVLANNWSGELTIIDIILGTGIFGLVGILGLLIFYTVDKLRKK